MEAGFSGKNVVVTGGASGIGAACCKKFGELGATVISVDIKENSLQNGEKSAVKNGKYYTYIADIADPQSCSAIFQVILDDHKQVDVLVNSCGIIHRASVIDTTVEDWDRVINVNLRSVFLASKFVLPNMVARRSGAIVNISSGWGIAGGSQASAYCASKGGVVLLTKAMALDYGPDNIRINCVCPGDTDTPLLEKEAEIVGTTIEAFRESGKTRPLGRIGQPNEIANVVTYLASSAASFVTGAVIVADGGSLAGTG